MDTPDTPDTSEDLSFLGDLESADIATEAERPVVVSGEVRQVVFANPDSGYAVIRLTAEGEAGALTVIGALGQPTPGEMLRVTGRWKEHPRFGRQLEAESVEQTYPATEHGIIRYLGSGLIKGVGETMAERLVAAFGTEVLNILDTDPKKLLKVEGIGKKKLEGILKSWEEQREIRSLMLFLQSHDVPTTYAAKVFKLFGQGAVEQLKENPYELAYLIRGIGFRTADAMALKLGLAPDSSVRVEAACVYALFLAGEKGHMFLPEDELAKQVSQLIGGAERMRVRQAVEALEERKKVVVEDLPAQAVERAVYLRHFANNERETAARMYDLITHPAPGGDLLGKVERLLPALEREASIELAYEQREAVLGAVAHKAFIVTGGPGTGKTTITRTIVRALKEAKLAIKLAAPTGRAAKRMSEASGEPASTLHRLLQYAPDKGFGINETDKLKADAVVVDEASMLDASLFLSLLRGLKPTTRLILVGDVNQLPSVGAGNVLADLIDSEVVPAQVLTRIYRQAEESWIVRNAHRMNEGQFPQDHPKPAPAADFFWVRQEDPLKVQSMILHLVCERIPAIYGLDPRRDIQVLAPMHKGDVGTQTLNQLLQERLNPSGPAVTRGKNVFRRGDRVLQLRNNYDKDVFNGDLGWIEHVDATAGELAVDFDGRLVEYDASDLDELAPAYAISVHKSQGSEYPAVVMPVVTQHFMLLQRNLLYTGLTRAKKLVILVGSQKAMQIGLSTVGAEKRWTHLRYRLQERFNA